MSQSSIISNGLLGHDSVLSDLGPKEHPGDEVEQEQDGAAIHLCLHLTLSLLCSLHLQFTAAKNSIT